MGTATPAELALQAEVRQLRERLDALQAEKDRLAAVIASIGDEVWFADANAQMALVNPAGAREFSLSGAGGPGVEQLAASLEVYRPDGSPRPIEEAPLLRALRGELVKRQEEIIRTPGSGQLRHREVNAAPVKDAGGNIVGSVCVVRDITDRKRAEEDLHNQRAWLRVTLNSIGDGVLAADRAGRITFLNPVAAGLTGWTEEEALGRPAHQVFRTLNEKTREPGKDIIARVLRENAVVALANHSALVTKSGGEIPVEDTAAPIRDSAGNVAGVVLVFHDVSAKRRAEEKLRESEERFRAFVMASSDVIYQMSPDWSEMRHLSGRDFIADTEEPTRTWVQKYIHPDDQPHVTAAIEEAIRTRSIFELEHRVIRTDGSLGWTFSRAIPLIGADGEITGWFGAAQDITERKRAEEALRESESRLRLAIVGSQGSVWEIAYDPTQPLGMAASMAHGGLKSFIGFADDEFPSSLSAWRARMHPDDLAVGSDRARAHLEGRTPFYHFEYRIRHKDGSWHWISSNGHLHRDASGRPLHWSGVDWDITERKQAEEALSESEAVLRAFFDSPGVIRGVVEVIDGQVVHVSCNAAAADMYGIDRHSIAGRTGVEAGAPEPVEQMWVEWYGESRLTGKAVFREYARTDASGRERWLLAAASYLGTGPTGHPRFAYTCVDITDRKRAEEEARESEEQFRTLANAIPQLCWMANPDGWIFWYNERWYAYTGTTPEQMRGWGWQTVHDPDALPGVLERWKASIATGEPFDMVFPLRGADGAYRPFLTRVMPVRDQEGRVARWFGTNTDVSEQRRAEEEARESRAKLAAALASMTDAVFISDNEGRFVDFNDAFARYYRFPSKDECARTLAEYPGFLDVYLPDGTLAPLDMWAAPRALGGETVTNAEYTLRRKDTGETWVGSYSFGPIRDKDGAIEGAVVVARDITEVKKAEERLRQAQKLESLGLLAGGVAHDFNNLLVGVIGCASLAQEMLPPDHPATEMVGKVVRAGEQAAHLTRQMLAYSGKGRFLVEALDLSALARDLIELVRPSIAKKIALHLDLSEELPAIEADRGQVQQILMNLAINAAEAIGSGNGLITVRTRKQTVEEGWLRRHPEAEGLRPGEYGVLEVQDTGCGMDAAVKAKIFDPFFSTKFTGRGLGLAAVAGIVRGHKGAIVVTSEPGKGSTFTVLFPAAAHQAERARNAALQAVPQGSGVVLVIDDEQMVRDLAKAALERSGYTVLAADGGVAAIDILRRHPGSIDLAILDLSMPQMSGEDTLPELRKIRPEVKVLISSGFNEDEAMTMFHGQRVSGFIQKPYTAAGLAEKVKRALA